METTPDNKRLAWPMLLLHLVAWGVTFAVGVAFVFANVQEKWFREESEQRFDEAAYYGWPVFCLEYKRTTRMEFSNATTTEADSTLHPVPLILNVVVGLLIVAGTLFVFVSPLWRRRKLFQVKLESLFILTATVAVFCALYRMTISVDSFAFIEPHLTPLIISICSFSIFISHSVLVSAVRSTWASGLFFALSLHLLEY